MNVLSNLLAICVGVVFLYRAFIILAVLFS